MWRLWPRLVSGVQSESSFIKVHQSESRFILSCPHTSSAAEHWAVLAREPVAQKEDFPESEVYIKQGCETGEEDKMTRKTSRRKLTVHWFRKGLRLSDNPALLRGIRRCETFRCIFILDPWFAGSSNVGTNKWRWEKQTTTLDQKLRCSLLISYIS